MKPIIRVEGLSKQYQIGTERKPYGSLRESLVQAAKAPFKRFGKNGRSSEETIWALKDVSFEVMPGEVVGIIGRNGAGKSTLLKILSRITEPTEGGVDLYGRVGSLLEVGTGFHPELTGRENIYLNGAILGMKRTEIESKFDEIVAFAEIERFLDTPVKRYSSGMYVRLAFAVAAHLEQEILIVDEVLAVGDAAFQKKCLSKMGDVAKGGRTVIFVSHNMEALGRLCGKSLLLKNGTLIDGGPTLKVIDSYFKSLASVAKEGLILPDDCLYSDVQVSVNGQASGAAVNWRRSTSLDISIKIHSKDVTSCPTVDLAFYRMDGVKLFAVRSDDVADYSAFEPRKEWVINFLINDPGLAPQMLYFDLGIRQPGIGPYVVLWQNVSEVTVDSQGAPLNVTADSFMAPQVALSVIENVV